MLTDQEIMSRCQQGETELLDLLIDRYGTALYTFCRRLCRNQPDAEDLFQDVWVAVLRNCRLYDRGQAFAPWLYTICLNRQRNHFRRTRCWLKNHVRFVQEKNNDLALERRNAQEPLANALQFDLRRQMERGLCSLSVEQRIPLLLHYFSELSIEEIGSVLQVSEGTVKSRLARGRVHLRAFMEGKQYG